MIRLLGQINSLPVLPRLLFYCVLLGMGFLLFWSAFAPSPQASRPQLAVPTTGASSTPSPLLFGTNLGPLDDNNQVLTSAPTRQLLKQIHVQAMRIQLHSGLSDETVVKTAQAVKDMGGALVVVLPGPSDVNALTDDVKVVGNITGIFGNITVYYEFGNEEDQAGISADSYTALWNAVIPLLKTIAPHARFAGPVTSAYDHMYLQTFLRGAQPHPDLVSWHEYTCTTSDSSDACIAHIDSWSTHITRARAIMTASLKKHVPVMISAWSYASATSNDNKKSDTVFLSTWIQKALQTLAANRVFAAMQYCCTGTTPLIDSQNKLTVQGLAFQASFTTMMKPLLTPTPMPTATGGTYGS